MKIDRSEIAPSGKRRLAIYVGDDELDLIHGMVKKTMDNMPVCFSTEVPRKRLGAMSSAIAKFRREDGKYEGVEVVA